MHAPVRLGQFYRSILRFVSTCYDMHMTFHNATPNLMTENVDQTLAWYEKHLGAEVISKVPSHIDPRKLQWGQVKFGEVRIMFQLRESILEEVPTLKLENANRDILSLFVSVEGLKELYDKLKAEGVEIVNDWHTTFYGMNEFMVRDNNGYLLNFAEEKK